MDGLVELASEENKTRAILVKEKFISDFEKSYEYRKDTPVKSVSFFCIIGNSSLRRSFELK